MEAGTELELKLKRGSEIKKTSLKTVASDELFQETRGFSLTLLQHHYQSDSWGNAIYYGWHQTWFSVERVGLTLKKLISGKISPKNLGGPGTIAVMATTEASQGTSRLLLFLTLLSANLAIIKSCRSPFSMGDT